jgi:hypothetical protein
MAFAQAKKQKQFIGRVVRRRRERSFGRAAFAAVRRAARKGARP